MTIPGRAGLRHIATGCVRLAGRQFGRHPGWSLASPDEPGAVCADLPADCPLTTRRLDLRQKLTGAYTGQVPARVDGGQRVTREQSPVSFAVPVSG